MDKITRPHLWQAASVAVGFLALLILLTIVHGCRIPVAVDQAEPVPVTVVPAKAADGRPIPLAVAEVAPAPAEPRSDFAPVQSVAVAIPRPAGVDWSAILGLLGVTAGVAGGGWGLVASRAASLLRVAVQATAAHADRMEDAETPADVERAKNQATLEQSLLGVAEIIAKIRGKA